MDAAEQAYEAAKAEIARVKAEGVKALDLYGDQHRDLRLLPPEIAELIDLVFLDLHETQVADLTPLTGMTGLKELFLNGSRVMDLTPLAGLTGLQILKLNNSQVNDLAPLAGLYRLRSLNVANTPVSDLRPIRELRMLGVSTLEDGPQQDTMRTYSGLLFSNSEASKRDSRLAELTRISHNQERTQRTLEYLRSLPPWPEPYIPAATPDGSPPKPIGGDTLVEKAEALSEKTPLAEELVQDPDTGIFSVRCKAIEKPDLLSATLGQVADAIKDVLHDPSNGLNEGSLEIRKLRRTLDRYANDPQRVEMDFTTIHQSLTRQVANEDLPPSEAILDLMGTLQDAAQGIRATDPAVAVNRKILQEQKLREMPAEALDTLRDAKPVLRAVMDGDAQEEMVEDVTALVDELPNTRPQLAGVTRDDAIMPGRDEAVRVFGRVARMVIILRKSPDMVRKLHQSTGFKAAEIMVVLAALVTLGGTIF